MFDSSLIWASRLKPEIHLIRDLLHCELPLSFSPPMSCPIPVISHFVLRRSSSRLCLFLSLSPAFRRPCWKSWNFRIAYTSTVSQRLSYKRRVLFECRSKVRDSFKVCKVSADAMISKSFLSAHGFLFNRRLRRPTAWNVSRMRRRNFRDLVPGKRKSFFLSFFLSLSCPESPLEQKISRARNAAMRRSTNFSSI